jgi:anti-anti-sigma factor
MRSRTFVVTLTIDEGTGVVAVAGEIDLDTADRVWTRMSEAFDAGCTHVVLDMSETTFIDSTGLSLLVRARNLHGDTALTLRSPSPRIVRTLEVSGLSARVSIDRHARA